MSRTDAAIGAVLFVAAMTLGTWYVPQVVAAGGKPRFYQEYFGSAVMLACGHGYVNPSPAGFDDLQRFLAVERDELPCDERLAQLPQLPLESMQTAYRYLMTTVALTWRLQGRVAWSTLAPLYGLFFAATIVLLYAVFRQGMGSIVSAALALVLAVSPLHVSYLSHLRDYSKAPFVLGLVLLAVKMALPPMPFRRALGLAAGAGVLTGIGMGFRNDLLVAVPAFVAVLLLFLPHDQFRRGWRSVAAPAVYLLAFGIALSPMWSIYRTGGGNSSQHLIVLGLGEPFTQELGLDGGGLYEWGYGYNDQFAHAMISGHATRRLGATTFLTIYGPDYDRAGSDYLWQVVRNFPADILTRAYASALRVLELPYHQKLMLPHDEYIRLPRAPLVLRDRFQRALAPVWLWIVGLALLCLSLHSVRLGLFAVLLVFYLSAYPALQFGERHYFHLEFIGWWALGFMVSVAGSVAVSVYRHRRRWHEPFKPDRGWNRSLTHAGVLWVTASIVLIAPLAGLRAYQQRHLTQLFQRYVDAPIDAPPLASIALGSGWSRFVSPLTPEEADVGQASDAVQPELIMAEFGGAGCDSLKLDAVFRYESSEARYDFSRTLQVQPPLSSTPLRVFLPAYNHRPLHTAAARAPMADARYGFRGLDVPETAQGCLTRLARVREIRDFPLLFELRLPPRWQEADLYHTIAGLESRNNGDEVPAVYTFPADLEVGRQLLMAPLQPLDAAEIAKRSPTLDTSGEFWRNSGVGGVGGKGPFLYLFEMRPRFFDEGRLALIQGNIKQGGISFGLVSNGAWIAQAGVTRPGEFTVVVRVPASGEHALVLANNLTGSSLRNDLTVRRVGWVTQPHSQ